MSEDSAALGPQPYKPTAHHVLHVKTERRVSSLEARRIATKEMLMVELCKEQPDLRRVLMTVVEAL